MAVAHYRINELDAADRVVDGYSVMCRSDTAALAMASPSFLLPITANALRRLGTCAGMHPTRSHVI
jgi:hypothetical protein